jgi:DNA-binding NarL/FixJ family response regulator
LYSFTSEEKEIALLLNEGETSDNISSKLGISGEDCERKMNMVREKIVGMSASDMVFDAVAKEYILTSREVEVLRYLRTNTGNGQIGAELFISEDTVKSHVRNLFRKLTLERRTEVANWLEKYAVRTL